MASITTINSGDLITDSRGDINNNFTNLNSDKIETSTLDTDTTLAANSDAKIPSQKAVKAYVDSGGNVNASETSKGIVEEATDAEVTAGTATGATGAKLIITPEKLATRLASLNAFGDGSDGVVTISTPTTITRDMYYSTLTVNDVLTTDGYRIFVSGTLSGTGTIQYPAGNNGSAGTASAGAGGTAFTSGGGLRNAAGSAGGDNSAGVAGTSGYIGTAGSAGGNPGTTGGNGGAGGSNLSKQKFGVERWGTLSLTELVGGAIVYRVPCGAGGGGGDNTASSAGGGGGASGGIVFIAAHTWAGTFTIKAIGGNGGAGHTAANYGGGGGGGAGGTSVVIYKTKTWTGSYLLTGGTGGTVSGGATAGTNGAAGTSYEVSIDSLL